MKKLIISTLAAATVLCLLAVSASGQEQGNDPSKSQGNAPAVWTQKTEEQKGHLKRQLYFLGMGPAKPVPLEYGRGVTNIYSKQDFVTGAFASPARAPIRAACIASPWELRKPATPRPDFPNATRTLGGGS